MKRAWLAGSLLTLLAGGMPAWGADDPRLENLALCRDSWLDWKKTDPAELDSLAAFMRAAFTHDDKDAFLVPTSPMALDGLKVMQVYPDNVGMGLGFSVLVDATFDVAKTAFEKTLGKPLRECETGDGMQTCALSIAAQRTVTLMSGIPPNDKQTLIGCFYFYEK